MDAIGVGAGTAGTLIDRDYNVVVYKGGEATEASGYRNRRVQSYIALRDAHRDSKVAYASNFTDDWDEYVSQLCSIRMRPGVEREEDIETKEMHLKHTKKSPDRADSAAMQMTDKVPTIGSQNGFVGEALGHSVFGGYDVNAFSSL